MFEIFVWVPTKGWKLLKRTKSSAVAYETAEELHPLEVKIWYSRQQRSFYSGTGVLPMPVNEKNPPFENINELKGI